MKLYGLTGGIASGKSTVSQMFRSLGAELIDADQIAREVVEPGQPALAEIAACFPGVLTPDGRLDRAALGKRVFADESDRLTLNAIIHPRIQQAVAARTQALEERGVAQVLYDAPLLIENGLHHAMNGVILVAVPPEVQQARLVARDGLSSQEAQARIASQLPLEEKRRHATWVVDNTGSLEATRAQVDAIWREIVTG
jgi:dephospho-CoA kinase